MSSNILVRPEELRSKANQVRIHANRIRQALNSVDQEIGGLRSVVEGRRAEEIRRRYASQRSQILAAPDLLLRFAESLEQAAEAFSKADQSGRQPALNDRQEELLRRMKDKQNGIQLTQVSTQQDLAAAVQELYELNSVDGDDRPIKIVKVGENDYLILIAGTDSGDGSSGSNDWPSNAATGLGVPSRYQLQVKRLIQQHIPPGANIHFAGHSQGGHVAMNLAADANLNDNYRIGSVNTFGSSGSSFYSHRVPKENYHNYLFVGNAPLQGDIIRVLEPGANHLVLKDPVLNFGVGAFRQIDPKIDVAFISENLGHGDYGSSAFLAEKGLPFSVDRWEIVGQFEGGKYDNFRLGWDELISGNKLEGGIDMAVHGVYVGGFAAVQHGVRAVSQWLPEDKQDGIDRWLTDTGDRIAKESLPSDNFVEIGRWAGQAIEAEGRKVSNDLFTQFLAF